MAGEIKINAQPVEQLSEEEMKKMDIRNLIKLLPPITNTPFQKRPPSVILKIIAEKINGYAD